jgi:hypothetical protein
MATCSARCHAVLRQREVQSADFEWVHGLGGAIPTVSPVQLNKGSSSGLSGGKPRPERRLSSQRCACCTVGAS